MSVTSRYVAIGKEASYGTAVAAVTSLEDTGDDWNLDNQVVEVRDTTRVGAQAVLEHNRRWVRMGGSGSINVPLYDRGLGTIWKDLLGSATAPAAVTATTTNRRQRTYRTSAIGETDSFTVRRGRNFRIDATDAESIEEFVYAGCVPVSCSWTVNNGEKWMLNVAYDAQTEATGGAATTQTYAASQEFFHWADTKILIDGAEVPWFNSFTLEASFNMDVAIHTLGGTANKRKPTRIGVPTFTGTLDAPVYTDTLKSNLYDKFRAGDTVSIVVEAQKASTTAADADILRFTMAKAQWSGSTPQGSPGANTTISGPFEVLHDGGSSTYALEVYLQNLDASD